MSNTYRMLARLSPRTKFGVLPNGEHPSTIYWTGRSLKKSLEFIAAHTKESQDRLEIYSKPPSGRVTIFSKSTGFKPLLPGDESLNDVILDDVQPPQRLK